MAKTSVYSGLSKRVLLINWVHTILFSAFSLVFFINLSHASDVIKYVHSPLNSDKQKSYYVDLLQLAIDKSTDKFGPATLQRFGTGMVHKRQVISLNRGDLNVMWSMTSDIREQEALPIRIPIFKGLIGFRILVIQNTKQQVLLDTQSDKIIKNMVALQGHDWLDTKILRANGFRVEASDWYGSLYKGISAGHYDYFPRSILEPWAEMKKYAYKNLVVDKKHLLYYPSAMYYFVQKGNHALAKRLEYGLNEAIDDGSFDALLYSFPAHKEALSKSKIDSRIVHRLTNPFLPKSAPLDDDRLWHEL